MLAMWEIIAGLLAGLGLFLFGMEQMTGALQAIAGDRLRQVIDRLTGNRIKALLTGTIVTAVIQSSSVTTVLVVGFVSAGVMSLANSVGVILGANVGTTVTAQIMAFKVTELAPLMIAGGLLLSFLRTRRPLLAHYGLMILGLGLIFYGMGVMGAATRPLRDDPDFLRLMQQMEHPLLGALLGAVFTAIIQSSSATAGIILVLAGQGLISLEGGIAIIYGAKIGTCVTAALAAIGRPRVALQTAAVHVIYNVLGVLLWIGFIDQVAELARAISPGSDAVDPVAHSAAVLPRQIANAYTAFTVINAFLFLPFTGQLAALAQRLFPIRDRSRHQVHLDETLLRTPFMALRSCRAEQVHLARRLHGVAGRLVRQVLGDQEARPLPELVELREDQLRIDGYLRRLAGGDIGAEEARLLAAQLQIGGIYGDVLDLLRHPIHDLAQRPGTAGLAADEDLLEDLHLCSGAVLAAFDRAIGAMATRDPAAARILIGESVGMENRLRELDRRIAGLLVTRSERDRDNFFIANELLEHLRQLYHLVRQVAKTLLGQVAWRDAATRSDPPEPANTD